MSEDSIRKQARKRFAPKSRQNEEAMPRVPLIAALAAVAVVFVEARQPAPVDVTSLFERYMRGERDQAVAQAAAITDLGPFRLRFVQDAPLWVTAIPDPKHVDARRAVMAAFLLEVTAARLETDWGRFADLIEWTCVQLRTTAPPAEFERAWHAASHALAGRARAREWLLGEYPRLAHQKPVTKPAEPGWAAALRAKEPPPVIHLIHALERFPGDPRFQLSRVVVWTWGRDGEPIRNVRRRDDDGERRRLVRAPQLEAIVALEPLTSVTDVAPEAFVRLGLVHFTVNDFAAALRAFESAQPIATEPAMQYLAFFNAGRALEALRRPEDAMRAYQQALAIVPDAESATVALTSLQFMRDDREQAVSTIDRVFNRASVATDPGRLIGYGSFFRWPHLKAAMREALP
jgi:tetratricopeptide (TPR) repeat protein